MPARAKPLFMAFRNWHRWLSLILLAQLLVWVVTAFGMTLVPRSAITAYRVAPTEVDAQGAWPDLQTLREGLAQNDLSSAATRVVLDQPGTVPVLRVEHGHHEVVTLTADVQARLEGRAKADIAARASAITGETIAPEAVSRVTRNSPEYQKQPLPAWRVQASKAILFFDTETGEYRTQSTPARIFENWMKTIHVMDYAGNADFHQNGFLTIAALLFVIVAILGIISVRRIYITGKGGTQSLRWHQIFGILLLIQVGFWASSGLGVVWLLKPLRAEGETHLKLAADPIALDRVQFAPYELGVSPGRPEGRPSRVSLTMLMGEPVYELTWPGRNPYQELWSAETGEARKLSEADRDAIARNALVPAAFESLTHWEVARTPADLDFYFYTGPYPVWKGFYESPSYGAIAIDQTTGHVHNPRTKNEIMLEQYYNVHVVNWRFGVVRYRQEPVLLAVIGLMAFLLITGIILQLRRMLK